MNSSGGPVWPRNIVVMGGGRWARVYVDVLLELLPAKSRVFVYSPRNADAMSSWITLRGFDGRVSVLSSLLLLPAEDSKAVIVVNSATDHESGVAWAINQGAPVLVEKPLALSSSGVRRLIDAAEQHGVYLAAAHVFLFAGYLANFRKQIQSLDEITSVNVLWADAAVEARHGEVKSFDPGVRIFEDCIPHVLSLLEVVKPGQPPELLHLNFLRGGAELELTLACSRIQYSVRLVRNGAARSRLLTVSDVENFFSLDFSREPGTIKMRSGAISASSDWENAQKPMSCMLEAFLNAAGGGPRDPRLGTAIGLRATCLSEAILPAYEAAQSEWLSKRLSDATGNDEDLLYALTEAARAAGLGPRHMNEESLSELIKKIRHDVQNSAVRARLYARPMEFVKSALRTNRTN